MTALSKTENCADFLIYQNKGDQLFIPETDLDSETGLTHARAKNLRQSGLLEMSENYHGKHLNLLGLVNIGAARKYLNDFLAEIIDSQKLVSLSNSKKELKKLEKKVLRLIEKEDNKNVSLLKINFLSYAFATIMTNEEKFAKGERTNGYPTFLTKQLFIRNLFPNLKALHPETVIYLLMRNVHTMEIKRKGGFVDGQSRPLSPREIADHDIGHTLLIKSMWFDPITSGAIVIFRLFLHKTPFGLIDPFIPKLSLGLYKYLIDNWINKPNQTWRQRELKIHVLFYILHEFQGFNPNLTLALVKRKLTNILKNDLFHRLNNPNDFSSKILKEKPVSTLEIQEVFNSLNEVMAHQ